MIMAHEYDSNEPPTLPVPRRPQPPSPLSPEPVWDERSLPPPRVQAESATVLTQVVQPTTDSDKYESPVVEIGNRKSNNNRVDEAAEELLNEEEDEVILGTAGAVEIFYKDDTLVSTEEKTPYLLMLAQEVVKDFDFSKPPYKDAKRKSVKARAQLFRREILRRDKNAKGLSNKTVEQLAVIMKETLPLTDLRNIAFVTTEEERIRHTLINAQEAAVFELHLMGQIAA